MNLNSISAQKELNIQALPKLKVSSPKGAASVREIRNFLRRASALIRDNEQSSSLLERFDNLIKVVFVKSLEVSGKVSNVFAASDTVQGIQETYLKYSLDKNFIPPKFRRIDFEYSTIKDLANLINEYEDIFHHPQLKGLLFEELVKDTFDKNENQQFFTPPVVVDFIVNFYSRYVSGIISDPACGTGGFLMSACAFAQNPKSMFLGFEIDERLAWVANMGLHLQGLDSSLIVHVPGSGSLDGAALKNYYDKADLILTNPPFGSDFSQTLDLEKMVLGKGKTSRRRGILFIERCLDLLKEGGRLAIVIDESVLNSKSAKDVREHILQRSTIEAIVSLPEDAFAPYATVKTSILFLKKSTQKTSEKTFFAIANKIGRKGNGEEDFIFDKDRKSLTLNSDLPFIINSWKNFESSEFEKANFEGEVYWTSIPAISDKEFELADYRLDAPFHHESRIKAQESLSRAKFPLMRLKDLCEVVKDSIVPLEDLPFDDLNYLGLANISSKTGGYFAEVIKGSLLKSSVNKFRSGDILFSKMRPELRKCVLVGNDLPEGICSSECVVLRLKDSISIRPQLLEVYLRSDLFFGQIVHQITGIGRPRVNHSVLLECLIPVPSIDEQDNVLNSYLEKQSQKQELIGKIEKLKSEVNKMELLSYSSLEKGLFN